MRLSCRAYVIAALALGTFGFVGLVDAQPAPDTVKSIPGIEVQTSVDLAEVYIGDLITYRVTITHDSTIQLVPPPLGANLGAFDVKDYEPDIETKLPGGRIKTETKFVLSTFTTGDYMIPPLPIMFTLPDKSRKVMLAEPVPIKVRSMLENVGDSVDIKPLKPQYEFKRNWGPYYFWGGIILAVLVAALLLWLKLRKKKVAEEIVDRRPAWEIAFEMLAMLKQTQLLSDGKYKEYYIELTEIVRAYLGRMYRFRVLDMTTDEFLTLFADTNLPENLFERTAGFLRHADLVKFAKYVPERERADADFMVAHDIIEAVRADYLHRQPIEIPGAVSGGGTAPVAGGTS